MSFGRHLTDEAMDGLVTQNAVKAFFEKAQINKRKLITILEGDGLTHEEIAVEVSRKMFEWLGEYQQTDKIKTDYGETDPAEEGNEAEDQGDETTVDENVVRTDEFESFHHRSPIAENEAPEMPTDETVKAEIQAIIDELSVLMIQSPLDCGQGIKIIGDQIEQLALIQQKIIDIRNRTGKNQIKEAA